MSKLDAPKFAEFVQNTGFDLGSDLSISFTDANSGFPSMEDLRSWDYNSIMAMYGAMGVLGERYTEQQDEVQATHCEEYREQLLQVCTEQGRDVEKLLIDADAFKQQYYDSESAKRKINDVGTYGVEHPEMSMLPEDKFLTAAELRTLDGEYVPLMAVWAYSSKEEAHRRGEDFDTKPYDDYYDLVFDTFQMEGFNRVELESYSECAGFASQAQEKMRHMMEDPTQYPPTQYLLTTEEIKSLRNEELLEQFTLAKFCAEQKEQYSHDHTLRHEELSQAAANGDALAAAELQGMETVGNPGADLPGYAGYYERLRAECIARGYSMEQLERDSDKYITAARGASLGSILDKGVALNLHMLACMNDANEQALYYYMTLTPQEREMEPRFKSVLTGETKASHGAGRWDGARRDRDPIQSGVTLSLPSYYTGMFDGIPDSFQVQADLMAVMNEGTEYEVKTYSFHTTTGQHLMCCKSPYLGNFIYDGNEWGIGYKEVPGSSGTKVPVFEYVGDVKADWRRAGKSAAGLWTSGYSFGDGWAQAGSTALNLLDHIDFLGIIPDSEEAGGQTNSQQMQIPYGVKNLDYTFAGNKNLQLIPMIPETVTSMHCTFMDCTEMWEAADEFGYSSAWHLPSKLEDASYTFAGCDKLECKQIGKMPEELLTIEGMFYDCSTILEKKVWDNWTLDLDAVFSDTVEADWSDDPYLMEQFAKPINENTSNTMKKNYEREEKERAAFQAEFSKPENLAQLPPEKLAKWQDAKAADAAVRTVRVLNADMTVPSIDEMSYNAPEANGFMVFLQRAMIDVGVFAALKGVTGIATESKLAGWAAGLGGTALLRVMDILPKSIEPALQWVNNLLPESAHEGMDKFIQMIHIPQAEDYEAADRERMTRYAPVALNASMSNSVWSADIFYDDQVVKDAMRTNGKAVAEYGVLQYCGEEGRPITNCVQDTVSTALTKAESVFDRKMKVAEDGAGGYDWNKGDGYDWKDEMRRYYKQMLGGVEGYSDGAIEGINVLYDGKSTLAGSVQSGAKKLFGQGESAEETQTRRAQAQYGLSYVNCDYTTAVMDSLKKMDDKYHFMTAEDWIELGSYNIYGVDTSELSAYQMGQGFEPTFAYGTEPVLPVAGASGKTSEELSAPDVGEKSTIVVTASPTPARSTPAVSPSAAYATRESRALPEAVPEGSSEPECDAPEI